MPGEYLHNRKDFPDLLRIIEEETGILAYLVEKDYWLMHVLYGLQQQGYQFNLKGGTSLSKGYQLIHRFSEDIDIYIQPPSSLGLNETSTKEKHVQAREAYYDQLAKDIAIDGIVSVARDHEFDDKYFRSGGIRLKYESYTTPVEGVKEGILLEAGFDIVTPFEPKTISSWAYEKASAIESIRIIDNRAVEVPCYHPGYTFVEKLQTIATKYRKEQETGEPNVNFMRQYYDLYCLLESPLVQEFIGSPKYKEHKEKRFPKADFEIPIRENEAFLLSDPATREEFEKRYRSTAALYYRGQPAFDDVLNRLKTYLDRL